jgi:ribonucleoside-diphosphate reductase alpha chain
MAKHRVVEPEQTELPLAPERPASTVIAGKECSECGAHAVIRKDGCDFCTNCSALGSCG